MLQFAVRLNYVIFQMTRWFLLTISTSKHEYLLILMLK